MYVSRNNGHHPCHVLLVAELALALDRDISALRSQCELCVLVDGAPLKTALLRESMLQWRICAQHNRLTEASDDDLGRLLLRFRPVFREPL